MICYRDRTFCISDCQIKCALKLTKEIEKDAEKFGLPVACAENLCNRDEKGKDK